MPNTQGKNVDLSMQYRLWGIMRQNGWYNNYIGVELTETGPADKDEITEQALPPHTYIYTDNSHPFVFIDESNEVWPSGVVVYDSGNPLPSGTYSVDYLNARITLNSAPSGAVTADLTIFEVEVREGYPKQHELEMLDLPVIAYELKNDDGEGWAIGTAEQLNRRFFNVFIMAKNRGQQIDLLNDVRKFIRFVPYVDYSDHKPLDENNALDHAFSYADQLVSRTFVLGGVRGSHLEPRPGGSDKEQYRCLISFELEQVG